MAPDIVLCGHVHQSPFTKDGSRADRIGRTWVFNAGHQIGPLPSHIVVDLAKPGAYWTSLAGAELVPLDVAPCRPFPPVEEPPPWLLAMYRSPQQPARSLSVNFGRQAFGRHEFLALLVGERLQHLVDHADAPILPRTGASGRPGSR
ncbi:MAG: hypothetical protein R3C69_02795 [Geminicoccaceae bacterium]